MSESILKEMGGIYIRGYPFLRGKERKVSPKALATKVLCRKHNSSLSELDKEGTKLFLALRNRLCFRADVAQVDIDGRKFERFILQRLCAEYFGKQLAKNKLLLQKTHDLDMSVVSSALLNGAWIRNAGLFFASQPAPDWNAKTSYQTTSLLDDVNRQILGGLLTFFGVSFAVVLYPVQHEYLTAWRPKSINILVPKSLYDDATKQSVVMTEPCMKINFSWGNEESSNAEVGWAYHSTPGWRFNSNKGLYP